ncbi:MAG TPA: helix-turn-helix domain-containing protein [Longimicrobiales bacterium]|nr:helix-turn-helix domain-containing protein [Longimicrobiales bacterium]
MASRTGAPPPASLIAPAARELLERLTSALEFPFTLTDEKGAVVASTGGVARGQIEVNALTVLQQGSPMEVTGESLLRWHLEGGDSPAVSMEGGAFATGGALYLPIRLSTSGAVLIAHGEPDRVRQPTRIAVPAVELALEFAHAAALTVRQGVGPDLALYRLLRGSRTEAREAELIGRVAGWDLRAPRVALVALPLRRHGNGNGRLGVQTLGTLLDVLGDHAAQTPFGRLRAGEWVLLPELEPPDGRAALRRLARELRDALAAHGVVTSVGIGELHADAPPLLALRRSYREALHAARWGARLDDDAGAAGVHELDSLGTSAFLAPGGPSRARLAARLLDPLRGQQELLDSLRAFFHADLSIGAAASRAGVHRHTVRSHLERIQELTGLDPRALDGALQLRLALLITPRNGGR